MLTQQTTIKEVGQLTHSEKSKLGELSYTLLRRNNISYCDYPELLNELYINYLDFIISSKTKESRVSEDERKKNEIAFFGLRGFLKQIFSMLKAKRLHLDKFYNEIHTFISLREIDNIDYIGFLKTMIYVDSLSGSEINPNELVRDVTNYLNSIDEIFIINEIDLTK